MTNLDSGDFFGGGGEVHALWLNQGITEGLYVCLEVNMIRISGGELGGGEPLWEMD